MDRGLAVALTAVVGALIALQAPVNSAFGRHLGTFQATFVSFVLGAIALAAIAGLSRGGFGQIAEIRHVPWWALTGGLLGAAYVTTVLVTVRSLGAGGVTAATITGQLAAAVALDRLGVLGLEERPISAPRLVGVALLAAGTFLVIRE